MLEPRTQSEWNATFIRWAVYVTFIWACSYALVIARQAGWF